MAVTNNFLKILGCLIALLLLPVGSWAACTGSSPTWTCDTDDTTSAQVQSCIDNANTGDTITFDAGTGTWTGRVKITKAINLIGAGIDTTIINSTYSGYGSNTASSTWAGLYVSPDTPSDNPVIRVSGFTLNFGLYNYGIIYANSSTTDELTNVRFDHLKISAGASGSMKYVFQWKGMAHGVVDNCEIRGKIGNCCNNSGLWTANNSAAAYEFGDESVLYFEDNTWTAFNNNTNFNVSGNGHIRYVFRYNDIILSSAEICPIFDQHKQCFGAEIYGNDINGASPTVYRWTTHRGGKWLMFNNYMNTSGGGSGHIKVWMESEDYTTQAYNSQPMRTADSYYWNNFIGGSRKDAVVEYDTYYSSLGRNVPLEEYDFWNYNASFDGSSGIGCGSLATMQAISTCDEGVGFWVTSQSCSIMTDMVGIDPTTPISGTLYTCDDSNNWVEYYTPYTYPHPLRGDTLPWNLRIIP